MFTGLALPGEAGSNVTSWPTPSTAVHCSADAHATLSRLLLGSMGIGVGTPGTAGAKVSSRPALSRALHCPADAHARATRPMPSPPSIAVTAAVSGACGSNTAITPPAPPSPPSLIAPTAMHWLADGQARLVRSTEAAPSIVAEVGAPGEAG